MNDRKFLEYLLKNADRINDLIVESMQTPNNEWVGSVSTGSFQPEWWEAREDVRRISEREAYVKSEPHVGIERDLDRLGNSIPLLDGWSDVKDASCIGAPCD